MTGRVSNNMKKGTLKVLRNGSNCG